MLSALGDIAKELTYCYIIAFDAITLLLKGLEPIKFEIIIVVTISSLWSLLHITNRKTIHLIMQNNTKLKAYCIDSNRYNVLSI